MRLSKPDLLGRKHDLDAPLKCPKCDTRIFDNTEKMDGVALDTMICCGGCHRRFTLDDVLEHNKLPSPEKAEKAAAIVETKPGFVVINCGCGARHFINQALTVASKMAP